MYESEQDEKRIDDFCECRKLESNRLFDSEYERIFGSYKNTFVDYHCKWDCNLSQEEKDRSNK